MNKRTCVAIMGLAGIVLAVDFAVAGGIEDANLRDFPRLAGETDDAPRFRRAIAAAPDGVLAVPKGEYEIATMLYVTNRCSLLMHPNAHLKAVAKMNYVVFWDGHDDYHALSVFDASGEMRDPVGSFIRGGDIDGRGLASCLALANAHHFTLRDTVLHNGRRAGLCVSRETGGHLYELIADNVYCKTTMSGLAGNVGIDCQCADCHFIDCIVVDYTVSIRDCGGGNRFQRCHVWGGTVPPKGMAFREWSEYYAKVKKLDLAGKFATIEKELLAKGLPEMLKDSIAFDIRAGGSVFDGCYADTAEIGFRIGSSTTIRSSGFYNNPRMGLRKSTVIDHRAGFVTVDGCVFNGAARVEKLYKGTGKDLVWRNVRAFNGDGMARDSAKLSAGVCQADAKPLKESGGLHYENPVWKMDAPDPTVWRAGDRYYAASTHHDVLESRDLVNWRATGGKLLEDEELKWIRKTWPNVWAPDVVKLGEWYNLYICYHNEGAHTAIAVYRSKDPQGPFKDRRILLKSEDDRQHEVIDPEVVRDEKGRVWLFFGHGDIRRVELTEDGLARKPGSRIEHVAGVEWSVRGEKKWWGPECTTEGPYLYRRAGMWYLFVSQGGWNDETYQVAVGRAESIDGRFFDKFGRPMVLGHATKILGSEKGDDFFGPGHNGEIFTTPSGRTYMFYHCHWTKSPDRKPDFWYVPRPLFLQEIFWDKDGWPYFGNGGKPQGTCELK